MRPSNLRTPPGFEMTPSGLIVPGPKHLLGPDGQPIAADGPRPISSKMFFAFGAQPGVGRG
jgi:hypothetical protein